MTWHFEHGEHWQALLREQAAVAKELTAQYKVWNEDQRAVVSAQESALRL